ncbi:MAG: site-2 protease family protein [Candidatus Rokuibacteriota bacterium]
MLRHAVTIFRVQGIPVRVHGSWLFILGLLTWSLAAGYFPTVLPGRPSAAYWIHGFVAALLLFASVFVHELAHAVAAVRYGVPVSGITLHVFGGVSQLEQEPDRPGAEAVIAAVGPLTSFAIAAALTGALTFLPRQPVASAVLRYLMIVNVAVGIFNLLPGFPLDGGRLLRAALWKARGSFQWATRIASHAGSGFAFLLVALGLLRGFAGELIGGLWLVLIGLFLRQAAQGSYEQVVVRRALGPLSVGDVMAREVVHVPADLPVARVMELFWRHHVSSFPVLEGRRVVGIVNLQRLGQVRQDRWGETPARDVMLTIDASLTAAPGDRLWGAFDKLSRNGLGRLAVVHEGALVGYLSLKDVTHVLAVSTAGDGLEQHRAA